MCRDLNPGVAAIPRKTTQLGQELIPCGFGALLFAMWLRQQERLCLHSLKKREKGLLLVGREKVPHGSGLTGDCSGNTVDGARTKGLPKPWTSTSFPEIQYPAIGKGEKEGLCAFVGILKNFSILMKT